MSQVDDIFIMNGFYMNMRAAYCAAGEKIHWFTVKWPVRCAPLPVIVLLLLFGSVPRFIGLAVAVRVYPDVSERRLLFRDATASTGLPWYPRRIRGTSPLALPHLRHPRRPPRPPHRIRRVCHRPVATLSWGDFRGKVGADVGRMRNSRRSAALHS